MDGIAKVLKTVNQEFCIWQYYPSNTKEKLSYFQFNNKWEKLSLAEIFYNEESHSVWIKQTKTRTVNHNSNLYQKSTGQGNYVGTY